MLTALGTTVQFRPEVHKHQIHSGILDYYDQWDGIDPRLAKHHGRLSVASQTVANELVCMATYTHILLEWNASDKIVRDESVVMAGAMTKSFMVSVRSACDGVASALAYVACEKPGRAPSNSLADLIRWAKKNPERLRPPIAKLLEQPLDWFWYLRSLRDHVVHGGAQSNIYSDRRQFYLWVHSPRLGWVTREPLLPLLAKQLNQLVDLGNRAAEVINPIIEMPCDRIRSRAVEGIHVPALHELARIAGDYARPSPPDVLFVVTP